MNYKTNEKIGIFHPVITFLLILFLMLVVIFCTVPEQVDIDTTVTVTEKTVKVEVRKNGELVHTKIKQIPK